MPSLLFHSTCLHKLSHKIADCQCSPKTTDSVYDRMVYNDLQMRELLRNMWILAGCPSVTLSHSLIAALSSILLILSIVILHLGLAFDDFLPQLGSYVLPWYPVLLFTVLFEVCILLLGSTAIGQHLHISCTGDLFFVGGMSRYVFDTDASVAAIT